MHAGILLGKSEPAWIFNLVRDVKGPIPGNIQSQV